MVDDTRAVSPSDVSLAAGEVVVSSPLETVAVPAEDAPSVGTGEAPAASAEEVRGRLVERHRDAPAVTAHEDVQLFVSVDELADGFFAAVYLVHREQVSTP